MHMRTRCLRPILPTLFTLLIPGSIASLEAQVPTATVYGIVQDPTGGVLPSVSVTLTNQGTNLTYRSVTDESGAFVTADLPEGRYTLKIESGGFKLYTKSLELSAGQTVRQTFSLEALELSPVIEPAPPPPR